MVTQLHLALVMAIDARLLVLDEPTLGLDILYRKQFYDSLLNDYFDRSRTIVVTTHQVEEIQHVLTDVMFINRGRIVFDCSMEEFESRYLEVMVNPEQIGGSPGAQADSRAPSVRAQHPAVRSCRPPATRRAWRRAHPEHRRLVCCRAGQSERPGPRSGSMNTQSNAVPESPLESQVIAPAVISASRRMYWSVRRELWENRSIYVAPLAAAAVFLLGFLTAIVSMRMHRGATRHEPCSTAPYEFAAALIMGTAFHRRDFLLPRRAVRRTPRSQHPVLEVAAGFRPHHRALEVAIPLVVLPLLTFAITVVTQFVMLLLSSAVLLGSGLSVGDAWDTDVVLPHVTDAALPPGDRSWSLVCAHLRLAAAGLSLGAARAVSVGVLAAVRDRGSREDCVQNFVFPRHAAVPLDRAGAFHHHSAERKPDGNDVSAHSGAIFQHPGSVGRTGGRRDIPRRSGPAAAIPRTDLIRMLA